MCNTFICRWIKYTGFLLLTWVIAAALLSLQGCATLETLDAERLDSIEERWEVWRNPDMVDPAYPRSNLTIEWLRRLMDRE